MKKDSEFFKLISDICEEKNIKLKTASFGYITELEKNGIKKHMVGTSLELNSVSSFKIASDKFATYSILVQNSIPVIKHNMVFNSITRSEYENKDIAKAMLWFDEYNGKVILKANDSSEGKDVFCITNKEKLKYKIIEEFTKGKDSVSICPFYNINFEYRAIFLDGEILFCYKKQKPFVIGDGIKTIEELISSENINKVYENLDLNYVPKENEKIEMSWKHNLSQGAIASLEIDEKIKEKVLSLAVKAGNAIGIRFASVDIAELETGELLVMEINSSVCMNKFAEQIEDGKNIEKEIFSTAIDRMFE
jgi:glutathione synthase/RimK-type ligase-like ATP-grasp enzyme